jgi:hypothetical protein
MDRSYWDKVHCTGTVTLQTEYLVRMLCRRNKWLRWFLSLNVYIVKPNSTFSCSASGTLNTVGFYLYIFPWQDLTALCIVPPAEHFKLCSLSEMLCWQNKLLVLFLSLNFHIVKFNNPINWSASGTLQTLYFVRNVMSAEQMVRAVLYL